VSVVVVRFLLSIFEAVDFSSCGIIVIPALLIFVLFDLIRLKIFLRRLKKSGFPAPNFKIQAARLGSLKAWWRIRKQVFTAARRWDAELSHWRALFISIGLAGSGLLLAIKFNDPSQFARIGALISLVGLYSTFIGFKHEDAIAREDVVLAELIRDSVGALAQTGSSEILLHAGSLSDQRPQRLANRWVFLVTIFGTILWAYGDIFLQRVEDQINNTSKNKPLERGAGQATFLSPAAPAKMNLARSSAPTLNKEGAPLTLPVTSAPPGKPP